MSQSSSAKNNICADAEPFHEALVNEIPACDLHPPLKKSSAPKMMKPRSEGQFQVRDSGSDSETSPSDIETLNVSDRRSPRRSQSNVVSQTNIRIDVLNGPMIFGRGNTVIGGGVDPPKAKRKGSFSRLSTEQRAHIDRCLKSKRPLEDEELAGIARHIGSKWKDIGNGLKLNFVLLDSIDDEKDSLSEKVEVMLNRWTEKYCERASVGRLAKILFQHEHYQALAALSP
ncbi:hypothetical protein TCAL_14321 [Tigriopus californicus]|uniref:Death domain-containing protein n=1 Tax=Tigriopus californicus TaxID=6832 RepID=A0A553NEN6_TIGCA|nr:uncharacterized protein LOC131888355 [Tigriopus californicus]TRY63903.1 hypothetical protein TCAL_14321 [Tigriopus californicus]